MRRGAAAVCAAAALALLHGPLSGGRRQRRTDPPGGPRDRAAPAGEQAGGAAAPPPGREGFRASSEQPAAGAGAEPAGGQRCAAGWRRLRPGPDARAETCADVPTVQDEMLSRWCAEKGPAAHSLRFRPGEAASPPTPAEADVLGRFSAWVCLGEGPQGMEGALRVDKNWGCKETAAFTADPATAEYARQCTGPDELYLSLEGPEVHALAPAHLGGCRYEARFRVAVPGRYRVMLVWAREAWGGLNELRAEWPPAHLDLPLGTGPVLQVGSADPAAQRGALASALSAAGLPPCDLCGGLHRRGRWVWDGTGPPPPQLPLRWLPDGRYAVRGVRLGVAVNYSAYRWRPFECRLHHFDPGAARSCLRGRRLLLQGDSQVRATYNALLEHACAANESATKAGFGGLARRGTRYFPPPGAYGACTDVSQVSYVWDTDLVQNRAFARCGRRGGRCRPAPVRMRGAKQRSQAQRSMATASVAVYPEDAMCSDVVVINAGQHQADGRHRWTFEQYRALLAVAARWLGANRAAGVWHETNALPFRKDRYNREFKDWRTLSRLRLFNWYAGMRLGTQRLIPTFEHTVPFALHTEDNAHYPAALLQQSAVQHLLNFVCPGGNTTYVAPHTLRAECLPKPPAATV
eukprot:TRINITY_DN4344_c1_g1_i1.p1 TRINITY_DN4344_c1_g1~~TRINITY_DN4344_c1_g1_i1.p1  ORF type:complete len:650 (+),score=163.63 TRINITY_DN4344_c1_g1_i1:49-1950(+)